MWNILFLFQGFLFTILLFIIFKSKRRILSEENRLFNIMTIENLITYIIEILLQLAIRHYGGEHIISFALGRLYLVGIHVWFCLFSLYVYYISRAKKISDLDLRKRKYNQTRKTLNGVIIIGSLLYCILPMSIMYDGDIMYSYGIATNVLKVSLGVGLFFWLILLILNIKDAIKKQYVPIYVVIMLLIVNVILQTQNPSFLIATFMMGFTLYIMYFTIENPDVQLIEQLNIERDRADRANNAKTEFLSSMSHEIRTPLNAIDGFSQLILEENNIDVIKEEAKDIMSASKNLLEIVNGILDISKIEADKLEIVNVEYEPKKVFEEVATLAKSRIGDKPVKFKEHIAEDLPDYLNGDYTRIKQIVLNLLTNAVKYTKDGFVDYSVRCVKQDNVCRLIIMVKDTGIGIKSENIDKLFNKFERFDKEQNITIEGTGLGLAITKKLVDLMNGRIIADSRYGTGSIFAVVLDQRIVDKTKPVSEDTKTNKTTFETARILVVDDNKINLKVASRLLSTYKVMVDTVESGFDCINKIKSGTIYNLILMDDMMPQMSGTETFRKLREMDNFHIPVVALTANAISGMKEKYLAEGFNDYISKPIEKKELERVLNTYLN